VGSAFLKLLGMLISFGSAKLAGQEIRAVAVGTGAGIAAELSIDHLRQRALQLAPGSDAGALEEVARIAARLLGLEGNAIFWPRDPANGMPIPPLFMVIDFSKGTGWFQRTNPALWRARARHARRRFGFRRRYASRGYVRRIASGS
jgi:hypothetical protein